MKEISITVNGNKEYIRATSLHTALHKLGERLENNGWKFSSFDRSMLSIVIPPQSVRTLPRKTLCWVHKKAWGTCTEQDKKEKPSMNCFAKSVIADEA